MSQRFLETPEDLFRYQLRSAVTMENHSLEALDNLRGIVTTPDLEQLFVHHAEETHEQLENLTKVFEAFGFDKSTAPSPATTGILKQADSLVERSSKELHDEVALASALGNEHFEIATYQGLILQAKVLKHTKAVRLLEANLEQETHTSEELHSRLQQLLKG